MSDREHDDEHERVLRELEANQPPVRPGQVWSLRDDQDPITMKRWGGVVRAERVLAEHPDKDKDGGRQWIVDRAKVPMAIWGDGLGVMPEINLRILFTLDADLSTGASLEGVDPSYWETR